MRSLRFCDFKWLLPAGLDVSRKAIREREAIRSAKNRCRELRLHDVEVETHLVASQQAAKSRSAGMTC